MSDSWLQHKVALHSRFFISDRTAARQPGFKPPRRFFVAIALFCA